MEKYLATGLFSMFSAGFLMGIIVCATIAPSHSKAECCAQFDVPLNTQLEQEMEDLYRDVYRFNDWTPAYLDPCKR